MTTDSGFIAFPDEPAPASVVTDGLADWVHGYDGGWWLLDANGDREFPDEAPATWGQLYDMSPGLRLKP